MSSNLSWKYTPQVIPSLETAIQLADGLHTVERGTRVRYLIQDRHTATGQISWAHRHATVYGFSRDPLSAFTFSISANSPTALTPEYYTLIAMHSLNGLQFMDIHYAREYLVLDNGPCPFCRFGLY